MSIAAFSPAAAYAAEVTGGYPDLLRERLTFDNLNDYAVNTDGSSVLFADGSKLILWTSDEKTLPFETGKVVDDVDWAEGVYYYSAEGNAYILPSSPEELPGEKTSHDFAKSIKRDFPVREGYRYYFDGDHEDYFDGTNVFHIVITATNDIIDFDGFSEIKPYGDKIYAVKDNALYEITDGQAKTEEFYYSNYGLLTQVPVQNAAETLKLFSDSPRKVNIKAGCNATKLNPDKIAENGYFYAGDELNARRNTTDELSGTALLLTETDGTRIVAQGKNIYMLNKTNATDSGTLAMQPVENALATPDVKDFAYSLPFVSDSTKIFAISPQDSLKVIASVEAENNTCLAHNFYLVEKEGIRGYVPAEFLNDLTYPVFNENEAGSTPDPSPENGDNVRTVVLVLLVILLVLIAAGYLTWLFTNGKKAAKEQKSGSADPGSDENSQNQNDLR